MTISYQCHRATGICFKSDARLAPKAAQPRRTPKRNARKMRSEGRPSRGCGRVWSRSLGAAFQLRITAWPLHAAPEKQSIQQQQDHRANDRHDPTGRVIFAHKQATDPGAYKCTGDAEQNRNDATTRILPRHQQFRDGANDKTNKNNPKNRVRAEVHIRPVVSARLAPGKHEGDADNPVCEYSNTSLSIAIPAHLEAGSVSQVLACTIACVTQS